MNRTLQYLKNIKFSHFINKHVSQQNKKQYITKNKHNHNKQLVRKFSTYNHFPDPPNDPFLETIIISSTLGIIVVLSNFIDEFKKII